jgi:GT2 family glycosyltransferase
MPLIEPPAGPRDGPLHDAPSDVALSVVILNWNARAYLMEALRSITEREWRHAIEVIVVDNASNLDDSVATVQRDFPQARLLALPTNVGFAAGNNAGLGLARGRHILFLNPDTILHEGALDALVDFMDSHPRAGACGPKLLNFDGSLQTSCRSFPSFGTGLFRNTFLGRLFPNNPWTRSYLMLDFRHDREAEVDWLSGSALCVRRTALEHVGCWDESFFMYCEDVDLCYRLKEAGWSRVYVPRAIITHRIGASSDWVQGTTIRRHHASMLHFYRKHHGRGPGFFLVPLAAGGIALRALAAVGKLYWRYWKYGVPNWPRNT